jgi:ankyrin repeat protein
MTAISVTALLGNASIARLLVENGAQPDINDEEGDTTLSIATGRGTPWLPYWKSR